MLVLECEWEEEEVGLRGEEQARELEWRESSREVSRGGLSSPEEPRRLLPRRRFSRPDELPCNIPQPHICAHKDLRNPNVPAVRFSGLVYKVLIS